MHSDKVGEPQTVQNTKTTAQPDGGIDTPHLPIHTQRGIGHEWKPVVGGENYSRLFGAGGHQDGATALIQTFANKQREDELTLFGMGDETIDSNRYQRNMANANTEFNFSQYKTGAPQSEAGHGDVGKISVTNTDGLYSGDMCVKVDPYTDVVDVTTQAIGALYGGVYKDKMGKSGGEDGQYGQNPFAHIGKDQGVDGEKDIGDDKAYADVEEEDGYDLDYYYEEPYYDQKNAEKQVQQDFQTGLRRVNTKTSQGRQLEKLATKKDIMDAYQSVNDQYAATMDKYAHGTLLSMDEKAQQRTMMRQPISKYQTTQYGLNEVSTASSKRYKSARNSTGSKLSSTLVGV